MEVIYIQSKDKTLINQIYYPVKTLGFGNRIGIWFQGCSIHCSGCMAKYTWDFDKKYEMTIETITKELEKKMKYLPDGLTISGGEPFDQPKSLLIILKVCHCLNLKEILVYSGYEYKYLKKHFNEILNYIDILISGPYIELLPTNKIWRGSDNQEIKMISERSIKRYSNIDLDSKCSKKKHSLQFDISNNVIFLIGIPRRGDLAYLDKKFLKSGIKIWQK